MTIFSHPCAPQEFLRNGGTLSELEHSYHISAKRHRTFPNLVQLKYDQVKSDFSKPLVRQSRGLILDEANKWDVVARPFDKFFNHGEERAASIDWSTASVLEKLDGSLMILYNYDQTWHVATSGMPDASGEVNGSGMTFESLFWDAWRKLKYHYPVHLQKDYTFMFELTSPFNRVVVWHEGIDLRLIGARHKEGWESHPRNFVLWPSVREFPISIGGSFHSLSKQFDNMDPVKQEGFVVVDGHFNRVKLKHPEYVRLHHLRSALTPKNILEVIRRGETAEVIAHFPEWATAFERLQARYDSLVMSIWQDWERIKHIAPRKEFARLAVQMTMPGPLFQLLDKRIEDPKDFLRNMHIDNLTKIIAVDDVLSDLTLTTV